MTTGEKATIREVVNMLDPIKQDVVEIKTLLTEHLKNYKDFCDGNKSDHKSFISIKAFSSWLTALSIAIGIVITVFLIR